MYDPNIDHYAVLGLTHEAEPEAIKAAYIALAKKFMDVGTHPDVERMKKINASYDILKDPVQKSAYDTSYAAANPSSSGPGSTRASAGPSAAPPPRGYYSIITVDQNSFSKAVEENGDSTVSFVVHHVSGELEPYWYLCISNKDGELLDDADFSLNPPDRFPTTVTVRLPTNRVGLFDSSFEVSIEERSAPSA